MQVDADIINNIDMSRIVSFLKKVRIMQAYANSGMVYLGNFQVNHVTGLIAVSMETRFEWRENKYFAPFSVCVNAMVIYT